MLENVPCFSGWKVIRRIGRGPCGTVYEIQKESDDVLGMAAEHSAMKVISVPSDEELVSLRAEYGDDETINMLLRGNLDNLVKEFKLLSRLQGHSNIVSCLDHEIVQRDQKLGWDILTRMELLTPLSDYSGGEAMEEGEIIRLGMDICRALSQCEKYGIFHKDIKPQNIFVNRYGDFMLGDFRQGVWHASQMPARSSRDYIAPEAFSHLLDGNYDQRADLYSLGLVLYWLLNERRGPFLPLLPETYNSKDQSVAWGRRMNGEALPRPAHGGRELQDVVLKACAFQPKERYQSAAEFYNALKVLGSPTAEKPAEYAETSSASAVELPFVPGQPASPEESKDAPDDGTVFTLGKESRQKSAVQAQKPEGSPAFQQTGKLPKQKKTKKLLPLYIAAVCAVILLTVIIGCVNCWFGHNYNREMVSEQYLKNEASCTTPAVYYKSCKCGRAGTETFFYGEANGHTWDDGVVTIAVTHTSVGTRIYTCAVCGQTTEETIAMLTEHVYDREVASEQYLLSAATCTAPAVYYKSCECGEAGAETFTYGEVTGHTWNEGVVIVAATHTTTGIKTYTCTVCGQTMDETIAQLAHTYDREVASEQYLLSAATCTSPAVYYKSCECGEAGAETFTYGEVVGHTWNEGVVIVAATHTTTGIKTYTCTVCGQTMDETIAQLTHTYDREVASEQYLLSAASCTSPAVYYKSCECGEAGTETFTDGTLAEHTWTAATCTEPKICSVCGTTEGNANGHSWLGATAFAPQTCQVCGEQTGFPTTAIVTGTCGNNLEWALDQVGTLAIRGSGSMDSYEEYSAVPWYTQAKDIQRVVIEDGVTSIGRDAFFSCDNLRTVTIPNSVTLIGESAFSGCSGLTSVTIPNSVTSIGDCAFYGCGLTSVTIPDSVTSIGSYAFWSCGGLTLVTIPDSVTSLGEEAFSWCRSLTSVEIPGGITTMGDSVFSFCTNLTSITVLNGVTSISDGAFYNCSSLASVTIPASVTSIGDSVFVGCSSLREILVDANNESFASTDGILFSKDGSKLICYPAKHSGTSYIVPDTVTAIGANAFQNCSDLISVTVPNSVTSIGDGAFDNCSGITSITIPDGVASIGNGTFSNCGSLAFITIPNSVTSIGSSAFYNCVSLTSIPIPDSVTSIGDYAFNNCSGLIAADIPSSVTSIGKYAFDNCSSLTSITIPNSVTFMGESAFGGCGGLSSVVIPDSVTSIESFTFYRCTSLTSVTIPVSVLSIGYCAFDECTSLTDVNYFGTEYDRRNIVIDSSNDPLVNARWQYSG